MDSIWDISVKQGFDDEWLKDVIEYFKNKIPMNSAEFYKLAQDVRVNAFTISHITLLDVLKDLQNELTKAISQGLTLDDFKKNSKDILQRRGWTGPLPYKADNVYRTNIQTAYMVGRWKQMTDPAVIRHRKYWMYDAINDTRTRPTHLAMDGKVYPAEHPVWDQWYPPNGFRCRCSVISLTEEDVKRMGLDVDESMPVLAGTPLLPDKGFATNPGKAAWQPDLSKYPEGLRNAYLEKTGRKNGL
ncbi:MAG: hypothetical protein PWQ97_455 [Tepidanaerobacteraceae bacterium]|nr:hypothetical protein [Tepidanaerobacteraceae bacterium]